MQGFKALSYCVRDNENDVKSLLSSSTVQMEINF